MTLRRPHIAVSLVFVAAAALCYVRYSRQSNRIIAIDRLEAFRLDVDLSKAGNGRTLVSQPAPHPNYFRLFLRVIPTPEAAETPTGEIGVIRLRAPDGDKEIDNLPISLSPPRSADGYDLDRISSHRLDRFVVEVEIVRPQSTFAGRQQQLVAFNMLTGMEIAPAFQWLLAAVACLVVAALILAVGIRLTRD